MQHLQTIDFWWGLLKITGVNLLLSADNAVVIALAARGLPPLQQKKAIWIGSSVAVVLRVVLTIIAVWLLEIQGLQIAGGLLLLWIGAQLLAEEENDQDDLHTHTNMMTAVRTILIADLIMSLDNVIGVAAAAQGDMLLLVLGLIISVPLVIFGSTLMMKVMAQWPVVIMAGAGLIGWVGGETIAHDQLLMPYIQNMPWLPLLLSALGAALVILWGRFMAIESPKTASE